jgi:BASS family bile acid:Na+ symporter
MGELYVRYEYYLAALQLAFAMFGMGTMQSFRDFQDVAREPRAVVAGTAIQLVAVPLVAAAFIAAFDLPTGIVVAVALVAAIPGGTISNVLTFLSKGNAPLSISITGITTLACLVTTPMILNLLVAEHIGPDFRMPAGQIAFDITCFLLLPLACGMLVNRLRPKTAVRLARPCIRASVAVIALMVVGAATAGRMDREILNPANLARMFGFFCALSATGFLAPRLLGLERSDRIAVEIEVMVRNINLAVMIAASLVVAGRPWAQLALMSAFLYGGYQTLVGLSLVGWRHYRRPRDTLDAESNGDRELRTDTRG